jgi:flagellar biosynthetic protein FliP
VKRWPRVAAGLRAALPTLLAIAAGLIIVILMENGRADAQVASTTTTSTTVGSRAASSTTAVSSAPTITVPSPGSITTPTVPSPSSGKTTISVTGPKGSSNPVLIVVLTTMAAFVPGLLMVATTFPRFLIVLGLCRQALGLQTTPPNQVLVGLAAFMTLFVMGPVFSKVNDVAIQPALKGQISQGQALKNGWEPLRDFLLDHTRRADLQMFQDIAKEKPATPKDISPRVLIPSFVISELRAAFTIGFLVWMPFLLVDLVVSSVLSALGMLMMPPVVISLPVKIALFVLVDGWSLLVASLLRSVGV